MACNNGPYRATNDTSEIQAEKRKYSYSCCCSTITTILIKTIAIIVDIRFTLNQKGTDAIESNC